VDAPDLRSELEHFERELRAADLRTSTIHTYVSRTEAFLRWRGGDYVPRGPIE
jgi:hypothetical protein